MNIKGSFIERSLEDRLFDSDGINPVSNSTKLQYEKKFITLQNHANRLGLESNLFSLPKLINILMNNGELSNNTLRMFRSALLHKIYQEALIAYSMNEDIESFKLIYDETRTLVIKDSIKRDKPVGTKGNTSASKSNFFDEGFYKFCISELEKQILVSNLGRRTEVRNDAYKMLYYFLKSNVVLGLRPIEWFDAREATYLLAAKSDYKEAIKIPALVVNNAKHTNGRGNGETREILLTGLNDSQKEDVGELIALFRKYNLKSTDPLKLIKMLGKKLSRLGSQYIETNNFTDAVKLQIESTAPYSTRHQAVNNAKMSGFSKLKIAGMFGHSSIKTHSKHYGVKGKGWMKLSIQPSPESIQAVNNATMTLNDLNEINMIK